MHCKHKLGMKHDVFKYMAFWSGASKFRLNTHIHVGKTTMTLYVHTCIAKGHSHCTQYNWMQKDGNSVNVYFWGNTYKVPDSLQCTINSFLSAQTTLVDWKVYILLKCNFGISYYKKLIQIILKKRIARNCWLINKTTGNIFVSILETLMWHLVMHYIKVWLQ